MNTDMDESLKKLSMFNNAKSLYAMKTMEGFLEWCSVSPIFYVARYQAEQVPVEEMEAALQSSFAGIHTSVKSLLDMGNDHWCNLDLLDDMLASLAWTYSLANRLAQVSDRDVSVTEYYEIVMQFMLMKATRSMFRK